MLILHQLCAGQWWAETDKICPQGLPKRTCGGPGCPWREQHGVNVRVASGTLCPRQTLERIQEVLLQHSLPPLLCPFQCLVSLVHRCPGPGGRGHAAQLHRAGSDHLRNSRRYHPVCQADLCGHAGGIVSASVLVASLPSLQAAWGFLVLVTTKALVLWGPEVS